MFAGMLFAAAFPRTAAPLRWVVAADSDTFLLLPNLINELRSRDSTAHFHSGKGVDCVIDGATRTVVSRGPGFFLPWATFEVFRAHLRGVDIGQLVVAHPDISDESYMSHILTKSGHPLEDNNSFFLYWPEHYPPGTNFTRALGFHLSLRWRPGSGLSDFRKYTEMFGV